MNEQEWSCLTQIRECVNNNSGFIGTIINLIVGFYSEQEQQSRERSNEAYLTAALLMSVMERYKNIKLTVDEKKTIEHVIPMQSPCNAFVKFCERFDIKKEH